MPNSYSKLSFAGKFRFWVVTIAMIAAIVYLGVVIFSDKHIEIKGEAFGSSGSITVGQSKR